MTDAVQAGTEWVPQFGMLEVAPEHAAVIRGLFEFAAFVADHPEMPAPKVRAVFFTPYGVHRGDEAEYAASRGLVDGLAGACGAQPETNPSGTHYAVSAQMGPVEVTSFATTPEHMAQHHAHMSYADNVQPEVAGAEVAGGAR